MPATDASSDSTEKFLFLDFDGPLHPSTTLQGKHVALLASSPAALREAGFFVWADDLEQMLVAAESQGDVRISVIVCSSWRAQSWFSPPVIRQALGPLGARICGYTDNALPRAHAIDELCTRMGIDDYAILDDDIRAFEDLPHVREHLVAVNPLRGVRDPQVRLNLTKWLAAAAPVPTGTPEPTGSPVPSRY